MFMIRSRYNFGRFTRFGRAAGERRGGFFSPGPLRIAVKVENLFGNAGYAAVTVTIPSPRTQPVIAPTNRP